MVVKFWNRRNKNILVWKGIFLLIFIVLLSFFSCSYEVPEQKKSYLYVHDEVEINFLIYMAGDNNLERVGIQNIKALQEVGSFAKCNILVHELLLKL